MTEDEVIALAREAGIENDNIPALAWGRLETGHELLTRFATLIEAKVKADLLAGAGEPSGHFLDTTYPGSTGEVTVYDHFRKGQAFYAEDELAAAVRAERDECAKVCDRFQARGMQPAECAGAIRARGSKV